MFIGRVLKDFDSESRYSSSRDSSGRFPLVSALVKHLTKRKSEDLLEEPTQNFNVVITMHGAYSARRIATVKRRYIKKHGVLKPEKYTTYHLVPRKTMFDNFSLTGKRKIVHR